MSDANSSLRAAAEAIEKAFPDYVDLADGAVLVALSAAEVIALREALDTPVVPECPYCHACWPQCLHCDGSGLSTESISDERLDALVEASEHRVYDGEYRFDGRELMDLLRSVAAAPRALNLGLSRAAVDVLNEREKQRAKWGDAHDDSEHVNAPDLACAAGCYVLFAHAYPNEGQPPPLWPWDACYWEPKNYRRNGVRAGALILAELERIDRAAIAKALPVTTKDAA